MLYVIPFTAIVGGEGIALYQFGYLPYTVILLLATMGIPMAVSKFVSKYNALGDYEIGHRLFKSGLLVMTCTGMIAFILMYTLAPAIASGIFNDPTKLEGNSLEDIVFTIRMVSTALIIVPFMSIIRGYFQGHQSMGPTALSQVIEQVVRIIFILVVAFTIIKLMDGDIGTAVGWATFGAFVGALGGLGVLLYYLFKRKHLLREQRALSTASYDMTYVEMYKELIAYALPLSFVGLAIPLFQIVDMFTYLNALMAKGMSLANSKVAYAAFSQMTHKLILIPVSLATAFSVTLVPTITNSFISGDKVTVQKQITQTYQIILFMALPASVGLSVLSNEIFASLYGFTNLEIGGQLLRHYAPMALFFSIFSVTAAILQGMNRQKYAIVALTLGLVAKLALNYWMTYQFGMLGGVWATYIGFFIAIAVTVWAIGKFAEFDYTFILKRAILIAIFTAIMGVAVALVQALFGSWLSPEMRLNAIVVTVIGVASGLIVYGYLAIRSHLFERIFGNRFRFLNR